MDQAGGASFRTTQAELRRPSGRGALCRVPRSGKRCLFAGCTKLGTRAFSRAPRGAHPARSRQARAGAPCDDLIDAAVSPDNVPGPAREDRRVAVRGACTGW